MKNYTDLALDITEKENRRLEVKIPLYKKSIGQKTYSYTAAKMFNILPAHLKNLTSKKRKIKKSISAFFLSIQEF